MEVRITEVLLYNIMCVYAQIMYAMMMTYKYVYISYVTAELVITIIQRYTLESIALDHATVVQSAQRQTDSCHNN